MNGKTYVGKQCRKCGGKVRYVSSRRCVQCKHELSKAEWAKKKAVEQHPEDEAVLIAQVLERHSLEA